MGTGSNNTVYETDSQRLLVMAVEQIAEAITLTNRSGEILYVNPAFERLTGYARKDAITHNPRVLKSGIQDTEFYDKMWECLEAGMVWHGRLSNRKKDGDIYTADVTISPVRDETGEIVNFVGVQRDITHELELESQLLQSQKLEAVGSLAAGIAHEINTPIQFIGSNTEFLGDAFKELTRIIESMDGVANSISCENERNRFISAVEELKGKCDYSFFRDEVERAISQTLEGVQRVASIVRAMKDFSHPDQGEMSKCDINDIIVTMLTVARNEYKYVADVELELDQNLPEIDCLRNELHQVFLNLIVNAAHAIESKLSGSDENKGKITISTTLQESHVIVSISDTGCGIKKEHQDHVFEQFFTTKEVGRGTGQGLALSRSIVVESHSGAMNFVTEPDVGTTFMICLPVKQSAAPARDQEEAVNDNEDLT